MPTAGRHGTTAGCSSLDFINELTASAVMYYAVILFDINSDSPLVQEITRVTGL